MKILIVDDQEENLYMLETLLKGSGYEVVTAKNGIEALDRLKEDSIELIISDILMPGMDGFQLCRECKRDDTLREIPLLFYTATYTDKKDEEFALSMGAEKFIIKPMEPEDLIEIIKEVLKDYKEGLLAPSETIPVEKEEGYLKEYSERLIRKLEGKMLDLEEVNRRLREEIKERKRVEDALENAYEELKTLDELKTDIISNVSHELRTPLTIAKGALELAIDEEDINERNKFLIAARGALTRQNLIVGDLLEAVRMRHGKEKLNLEGVNLRHVLLLIQGEFKPLLTKDKIRMEIDLLPRLPDVKADYDSLKHILRNLLSNAIKFTEVGGKITVKVTKEEDFIKICVIDTGVGIPKEKQKKIFEPLYQIDSSTTRRYEGIGLGLSIVKELVKAHGGRITVHSTPGKGSVFCVMLPAYDYDKE